MDQNFFIAVVTIFLSSMCPMALAIGIGLGVLLFRRNGQDNNLLMTLLMTQLLGGNSSQRNHLNHLNHLNGSNHVRSLRQQRKWVYDIPERSVEAVINAVEEGGNLKFQGRKKAAGDRGWNLQFAIID